MKKMKRQIYCIKRSRSSQPSTLRQPVPSVFNTDTNDSSDFGLKVSTNVSCWPGDEVNISDPSHDSPPTPNLKLI